MRGRVLLAAYGVAAVALLIGSAHARSCGPENAWLLAIPSAEWQGPPTVKMVAAGQKRCLVAAHRVKTVDYKYITIDEAQRRNILPPAVSVYETIDNVMGLPRGTTLQSLHMTPYDGTEAYAKVR